MMRLTGKGSMIEALMAESGCNRAKDKQKYDIFRLIYENTEISHKAISQQLKLRPLTVTQSLQELIEDKLIVQASQIRQVAKGRPVTNFCLNPRRFLVLSAVVSSRFLTFSLIDLRGNFLHEEPLPLPSSLDNAELKEILVNTIAKFTRLPAADEELVGVVFSLPGWLDIGAKKWVRTARWKNLACFSFAEVEERCGLRVSISPTNTNMLHCYLRQYQEYQNGGTAMISWGWRIIMSYGCDGEIFTNRDSHFGHIGHQIVNLTSDAQRCDCGAVGCLETEAALWSLLPSLREQFPDAPADEADFAHFIASNDLNTMKCVERAIPFMIASAVNVSRMFYPERILMTGVFLENKQIVEQLTRQWLDISAQNQLPLPEMIFHAQKGMGADIGAALPVFDRCVAMAMKARF